VRRAGQVVLQLKSPYKDGTTHIVMEPLEFMERLRPWCRPRLHLIRFHGVLAPNAKLRSKIVPAPPEHATETSGEGSHAQCAPARISWARLLKRVFDVDVEQMSQLRRCLEDYRRPFDMLWTGIDDPPVIVKILSHLGLLTRGPPRAPARRVDLFQTI
jgi:Putative transposase